MTDRAFVWRGALVAVVACSACAASDRPNDTAHVEPAPQVTGHRADDVVATLDSMGLLPRGAERPATIGNIGSWLERTLDVATPLTADAPLVLTRRDRPGAFLEITVIDAAAVPAETQRGSIVFPGALGEGDLAFVRGSSAIEELRLIARADAPSVARWRLRRGPNVATVRVREGRVEAIDATGLVLFHADPMVVIDARGVHRDVDLQLDGEVLSARWDATGLTFPIALDPAWSVVAKMGSTRVQHTATTLVDGTVLVTGGFPASAPKTSSTELYDPTTNTWTPGPSLALLRANHTAMRLASGKVIVAGGAAGLITELYDPTAKTWTTVGPLAALRGNHEAVLLASGKVLIVGGETCPTSGCTTVATADLFDPATNTWSSAGSMATARKEHTATLLASGAVLVAGGYNATGATVSSAEIYEPSTNTWHAAASMNRQHADHVAAKIGPGALVAGGLAGTTLSLVVEQYDVAADSWKIVKPLSTPRNGHVAITLGTGKLLVVGGAALTSAELYDPVALTWSNAGSMSVLQERMRAALLNDGRVLFTGGNGVGGTAIAAAELFSQATNGTTCVDAFDCASGSCIDGFCCDVACTGSCQACDLPSAIGTCTDVTGAPHGTRTCGGFACVAGACGTTCAGEADCDASHACTAGKCVPKKGNGVACGATPECTSGKCVDGVCCDKPCTDQCSACDLVGKVGVCSAVSAAPPHGTRTPCKPATCSGSSFSRAAVCNGLGACSSPISASCVPFACNDAGCLSACTTDAECADNFICRANLCVAKGAHCGADNSSIGVDGVVTPCAPNVCRADGTCGKGCANSTECVPGFVCDDASKTCIAPTGGDGGSSGGCEFGGETSSGEGVVFVALGLLAMTRMTGRRRRGRGSMR